MPRAFKDFLGGLTGEASRWPRDDEFRKHWLSAEIYPGRLDAAKLRAMFHRLEMSHALGSHGGEGGSEPG
jgi:hypothetical protein